MPTITLDKKDVLQLLGKNVPDNKLKERISMLGTDLESMKNNEIVVEVFPNRPDMLSEEGFARALSSFIGVKKGLRQYKVNKSKYKYTVDAKVKKVRPAVAAAVVKGVKLTNQSLKSLMEIQEKLCLTHGRHRRKVAIGVHDLDKITFPLKYTTKPRSFTFMPLETAQEQTVDTIVKTHKKGKEYSHLVDGFNELPMWVDAHHEVLSMPPIINSERTKVTKKSRGLFFDVTGTDQHAVDQALNILLTAVADRGGTIYQVNNHPTLSPQKIKCDLAYVNQLLGLQLTKSEIKRLLERMGLTMQGNAVLVPCYRTDMLHPIDVVEDVAIAYGYENVKEDIPNISTVSEEHPFSVFTNKIAEILAGLGLLETSTYHLLNKEAVTTDMRVKIPTMQVKDAKSSEHDTLRPWLIPSLMQVLKNNKHHEYPQRVFEIGTVFKTTKNGVQEATRLAVLLSQAEITFTEAKQVFDALCSMLGITYASKETTHDSFIPGRVARLSVKGRDVAYIGELHPEVLTKNELEMPVVGFELNVSDLYQVIKI